MKKSAGIFLLFYLFILLVLCGQQNRSAGWQSVYAAAEQYYNADNPTASTDSLALVNYQKLIALLVKEPLQASVLAECYFKCGILYQAAAKDSQAIGSFTRAIGLRNTAGLPDSIFFQPILFAGASYYTLNNYDSALYYFKQAEQIANRYAHMPELERLYNKVGALYYQTGNYRQSINYFNKSVSLLNAGSDGYTDFLVQYKSNLASAYVKLREYDRAMEIYESLLQYQTATRPLVLHNIGNIYLEKGDYAKALQYLERLEYNHQLKLVDLARINTGLGKTEAAKFYLDSALAENKKINGRQKNITQGLALKYYGDWEMARGHAQEALQYYQQSVIQLDPDFFETDILKNPAQFNGLHSSFNLFNSLVAKATAFKTLYFKQKNAAMLSAALDAYQAAFSLAQYVERFLDTDEARLFLKENVEGTYAAAVETAISAYEITHKKEYLQQAFVFSETSKASVLQVNRQQLQIEQIPGIPQELLHEEHNIKATIARLTLQAAAATDSMAMGQAQQQISNLEIKLSKVQEKLNENPRYNLLRYNNSSLSVKQLQDDFIGKNTALLSFYFTRQALISFVISSDDITYSRSTADTGLRSGIIALRSLLEPDGGSYDKIQSQNIARQLFTQLIKPVYPNVENKKHLVIIPHNELQYIPFEVLENAATGNLLLKDFAISYNYSASFLSKGKEADPDEQVLSFAPFTGKTTDGEFSQLTASLPEVEKLKGKVLTDTAATKANFIKYAENYGIIHLATHANANDSNPVQSFIAFYPQKGRGMESKLYEPEIYNLNLSKTSLVVLSACETGRGRLIKGEGVMSLSRAFSYAGCPSVITSLWKAGDKATAFIMQELHANLQRGLAKDEALQQAKLAYLNSSEVDAGFKTPGFWANIILVGDTEAVYKNNSQLLYWLAGVTFLVLGIFLWRRYRGKRQKI